MGNMGENDEPLWQAFMWPDQSLRFSSIPPSNNYGSHDAQAIRRRRVSRCLRIELGHWMTMKAKTRSLDRIDLKILRALQDNARISYVDLAAQVGLSTTPCLERVKRLERSGIIRGYKAVLDPRALKAKLLVFVEISLESQSPAVFDEFRRAVRKLPQVQECHLVSGQFDYILKCRIPEMSAYRQLLGEVVLTLPGVKESKSYVVMEEVKEEFTLHVPDVEQLEEY